MEEQPPEGMEPPDDMGERPSGGMEPPGNMGKPAGKEKIF